MSTIKFTLDREVRRSSYNATKEESLTFEKLQQLAVRLFPVLDGKEFQVCYHDDENDLVTFSSDEELTEAIKFMLPKSTTLKFTLQLLNGSSTNASKPTTSKGRIGKKKGSVVLPSVSLSPQEAVAASALLNQSADSDSSDDQARAFSVPKFTSNKRPHEHLEEGKHDGNSFPNAHPEESTAKRRQCYTVAEKLALIHEYNALGTTNKKPMKQFAVENGINQKTFSSWMKEYQDGKLTNMSAITDTRRIRLRKAEYPEIENLLIQFVESYDPNQTVSWSLIRTYALKYAKDVLSPEDFSNFKASDGWIQNFLKRNHIVLHRRVKPENVTSSGTSAVKVDASSSSSGIGVANASTIAASDDSSESSVK